MPSAPFAWKLICQASIPGFGLFEFFKAFARGQRDQERVESEFARGGAITVEYNRQGKAKTAVIISPPRNRRSVNMVDEHGLRRLAFADGVWIRLANGQAWCFPDQPSFKEDSEYCAVLSEI